MEAIEQMGGTLYRQADWPLAGGPTRSLQDILSDPEDPDRAPAPSQRTGGRRSEFIEDPEGSANLPRHPDGSVDIESLRGGRSGPHGWELVTHSGLAGDEWTGDDMNPVGPDYSQPDPFDASNPEEAAQAENIEETEQLFSQWDEERDRRRRGL